MTFSEHAEKVLVFNGRHPLVAEHLAEMGRQYEDALLMRDAHDACALSPVPLPPDPVLSAATELRDCIRGLTAIVEELCSLLSDRKACGVRPGETCEDCVDSCECGDVDTQTRTGDDPNLRIRCSLRPGHDGAHAGGGRIWPRLA